LGGALVTLKKNKEFGFVYRRGRAAPVKNFTLIYVKSRYGGVRAGFSVSKKAGNAVARNRARRRLKEAFRRVLPEITGNRGLVFVARACVRDAAFGELVSDMRKALGKARILG
jgi:ribonuclease P protein component